MSVVNCVKVRKNDILVLKARSTLKKMKLKLLRHLKSKLLTKILRYNKKIDVVPRHCPYTLAENNFEHVYFTNFNKLYCFSSQLLFSLYIMYTAAKD